MVVNWAPMKVLPAPVPQDSGRRSAVLELKQNFKFSFLSHCLFHRRKRNYHIDGSGSHLPALHFSMKYTKIGRVRGKWREPQQDRETISRAPVVLLVLLQLVIDTEKENRKREMESAT